MYIFDGLDNCRVGAELDVTLNEKTRTPAEVLDRYVKRNMAELLADTIVSKLEIKQRLSADGSTKYYSEMYVFTQDELERFITNVRMDERERSQS